MTHFEPEELARWCAGRWVPHPPPAVRGVSIDSRTLQSGDVFLAVRGPRFDGHHFVEAAFRRGAAGAVVAEDYAGSAALPGPALRVRDTRKALADLARGHRARLPGRMVGITGSVGKSTVKEFTAGLLARRAPTARTRGNWNNDIGLPLSLLDMKPSDAFGVFEIGMNHPGELEPLCLLLQPSWGLMTPIGPGHLCAFDSVEAIAREKAALFQSLPEDGGAVACRDEAWFEFVRASARCRVVTTSMEQAADYTGRPLTAGYDAVEVTDRRTGERVPLRLPSPGRYMMANLLLAVAVARELGLTWEEVQEGVAGYRPLPLRWQREQVGGVDVVNDAYNANPMSMRAALEAFAHLPVDGRRWLVLADMLELGGAEEEEHRKLGAEVASGRWAGLVVMGRLGALIADGAEAAGWPAEKAARCADHAQAAAVLRERVRPGDAVLLKASRGLALEKILAHWRPPPTGEVTT